jgi:hypothetical protein
MPRAAAAEGTLRAHLEASSGLEIHRAMRVLNGGLRRGRDTVGDALVPGSCDLTAVETTIGDPPVAPGPLARFIAANGRATAWITFL